MVGKTSTSAGADPLGSSHSILAVPLKRVGDAEKAYAMAMLRLTVDRYGGADACAPRGLT